MKKLSLSFIAVLLGLAGGGCAEQVEPTDEEATYLPFEGAADRASVSFDIREGFRTFDFDCVERCDVELAVTTSVQSGDVRANPVTVALSRPDGFRRSEIVEGERTLRFAQLPAGRYRIYFSVPGVSEPVHVNLRATFGEASNPFPGGYAAVFSPRPGHAATLSFECEEASGCDMTFTAKMYGLSGAVAPTPARLSVVVTDPQGFENTLQLGETFELPAAEGAAREAPLLAWQRIREMPAGSYTVRVDSHVDEELGTEVAVEWTPRGTSLALDARLASLFAARQRAAGCTSTRAPELDQEARRFATARHLNDPSYEVMVPSGRSALDLEVFASQSPLASEVFEQRLRDSFAALGDGARLGERLSRCEDYGLASLPLEGGSQLVGIAFSPRP